MMQQKEIWNEWAKGKYGPQAVMMTSRPLACYRNFIESRAFLGLVSQEIRKDGRILEAGCGNGRWLKQLHNQGYADLFGSDFSRELIIQTKSSFEGRLSIMSIYDNGFRDRTFDAVLLFQVLSSDDPDGMKKVFDGISRMLKKNGKIVIMDEFSPDDIRNLSLLLSGEGFRLKRVENVRTEAFHRILNLMTFGRTKGHISNGKNDYSKTHLYHYIKIALELPIDILLSPFFKGSKLFFEKILVFERT